VSSGKKKEEGHSVTFLGFIACLREKGKEILIPMVHLRTEGKGKV
jgi:hypothetical protein